MASDAENVVVVVRPYKAEDLEPAIAIYQSGFAEPPWNEYMKCSSCGIEYGEAEAQAIREQETDCKKCGKPLELEEFWSRETVKEELEFALAQADSIVLVAEDKDGGLAGILWGYRMSFEKYPFLKGKVRKDANYWDTVAVKRDKRGSGLATLLGGSYLECAKQLGVSQVVGRIREEVEQTHLLVKKFGFSTIPEQMEPGKRAYDPDYHNNLYITKDL